MRVQAFPQPHRPLFLMHFLLHSYFFLYFIIYLFAHLLIVLEIKFMALDMLGKHPTTVPYILLLITRVLMS